MRIEDKFAQNEIIFNNKFKKFMAQNKYKN